MIRKPTYEELAQRVRELEQAECEAKKAEWESGGREALFRLVFHSSPDAINLNRVSDGKYIDINDGFKQIMGYTREDVIRKTSLSLNIWKNPEDRNRLVNGLKKTGYVENLEARFVGKDGKIRLGLMSARVLRFNGEDVILSITRDITDRRRDEETLKESQEQYRNLFELSPEGIVIWQDEKAVLVNQAAVRLFGAASADEMIGKPHQKMHPISARNKIRSRLNHILKAGLTAPPTEYKVIRLDGQMIDVEAAGSMINYKNRPAVISLYRDISDRKQSENALRESELKYKILTENSIAGIFIHQDDK
jgi:two-component system, cell cycle sensor histidine kinase and response regulator CckA